MITKRCIAYCIQRLDFNYHFDSLFDTTTDTIVESTEHISDHIPLLLVTKLSVTDAVGDEVIHEEGDVNGNGVGVGGGTLPGSCRDQSSNSPSEIE